MFLYLKTYISTNETLKPVLNILCLKHFNCKILKLSVYYGNSLFGNFWLPGALKRWEKPSLQLLDLLSEVRVLR